VIAPSVAPDIAAPDAAAPGNAALDAAAPGEATGGVSLTVVTGTQVQRELAAEITWIDGLLASGPDTDGRPARPPVSGHLGAIAAAFELTPFERDTLLLAAAVELDGDLAARVAARTTSVDPRPTFGLALLLLPDGHWDALAPTRPLRRARLVKLGEGTTLATRRLALDEEILHRLTGVDPGDGALEGYTATLPDVALAPSQRTLATEVSRTLRVEAERALVHVDGEDAGACAGVAHQLAAHLRPLATVAADLLVIEAAALPAPGPELTELAALVDRRARLTGAVPAVRGSGMAAAAHDRIGLAAAGLTAALSARVVLVLGDDIGPVAGRATVHVAVPMPRADERRQLWRDELAATGRDDLRGEVADVADDLAHHHRLGAADIRTVVRQWSASQPTSDSSTTADVATDAPRPELRQLVRELTRTGTEQLAQRVEVRAAWSDLVLPAGHLEVLRDLVRQLRQRARVHGDWGFGARPGVSGGVTALFAGEPGTGKTLAAEVIAGELDLDLLRVDLSTTVDKYIGETEKNLARLFSAAEASGAVLLFDEADALFGRRTEVRDSHDRYANLEVSYLLQRMEAYGGLAILTTNQRGNLDRAFLRRLRVILTFPFPDTDQRAEIWRRAFPAATPTEGLDPARLARAALTGGSIAAIALSAALASADEGGPVTPRHLLQAARIEAAKNDRSLTDAELAALS
jgi:hypothetical protein